MIRLNLQPAHRATITSGEVLAPPASLDAIERDVTRVLADLTGVIDRARSATVYLPADTLMYGAEALMPAERMGVLGGQWIGSRFTLGAMRDVTGRSSRAHVHADPQKLARALLAFDRSGCELAGWIHSHPGKGPMATMPSDTDHAQYTDWTRDFGDRLVGLIVVADGFVRMWGEAIERGDVRVELVGTGVHRVGGPESHVYQLDM